jgi:hypothetical protein
MQEINELKSNLERISNESHSLAYELLQETKKRSKRDFIVIVILIILFFVSNIGWVIFINQFEISTEEIETLEQLQENVSNNCIMKGTIK